MTNEFHTFEHKFWDKTGEGYDNGFGDITAQVIEPTLKLLNLQPSARLLDVACGPGYTTEIAQKLGINVIGVDFSAAMIQLAKQLHHRNEFYVGDAQALNFDNQTFDAVSTHFGLLHFSDAELALREFYRVLNLKEK